MDFQGVRVPLHIIPVGVRPLRVLEGLVGDEILVVFGVFGVFAMVGVFEVLP